MTGCFSISGIFEANKPVHAKYAAIRWKKPKEKYAADHKEELDAYNAALRYFKVHLDGAKYSTKKLAGEQAQLSENIASKTEALTAVQEDVKILRDVRHWLNQVCHPSSTARPQSRERNRPSSRQSKAGRSVSGKNRPRNGSSPAQRKNRIWNFNRRLLFSFRE